MKKCMCDLCKGKAKIMFDSKIRLCINLKRRILLCEYKLQ
jgi:hypothetical protein